MAVARTFFDAFRTFRNQAAMIMGTDVTRCPEDVRAMSNADLAAVAVLAKVLVEKGVITGAQLQAAANAALGGMGGVPAADGSVWDPEVPTDQIPPADSVVGP